MFDLGSTQLSTPYLIGAVAILFVGYRITQNLLKNAKIRSLGARAPVRTCYLPWGIDLAYDIVTAAMKDKTYDMWVGMFQKWCGPGRYTIEAGVGQRVVLTADPENIKAILATQFKEYGKGEEFRKDWHAFLGNGIFTTDGQ